MSFGPTEGRLWQGSSAQLLDEGDERLVEEVRAGNEDAFAVIFLRYHRLVHLIALRILRDAGEAEDLTQSVFFEIYRKLGQFDPARGTLKGWLIWHASCRSINRLNYLTARQFRNQRGLKEIDEKDSVWSSDRLPTQETARLSTEALALLPEPQRATIQMLFYEGLTLKEIAEHTGETFSNVRHHYYRGLSRLRDLLGPSSPGKASSGRVAGKRVGHV